MSIPSKMAGAKNVLIVYAHQEPKSFNGALKDLAVKTFKEQGHNVVVSDLYEMGFDPSATKNNFTKLENPDHFRFDGELRSAVANGSISEVIRGELDKVLAADLVVLQTPMYWLGLPAIVKGWIDRCFAGGVFFVPEELKWFDEGPLKAKKIVLSITTRGSADTFSNKGLFGDMNVLLWPIQNCLRFTGFNILAPQISYAPQVSQEHREAMLKSWEKRLANIWTDEPLKFISIKNFDAAKGFTLTDEYVEQALEGKEIQTVGQNLGRPLQPGSMTSSSDK